MNAPNCVLLPKLFPNDLISIGQLLCNPLAPNTDTFRGGCIFVGENDISTADPVMNYEAFVSLDKRGRFDIGLTKFLRAKLGGRKTNMLSVKAKSLKYSTLKDSMDVFRRIYCLSDARDWILGMILCKKPCYLVIGIQTLCEAELRRVVLKEGVVGGGATVPLDASWQIHVHVQGDVSTEGFGSSVSVESGVFGIQVQRLHSRMEGEIRLNSDISWRWSYRNGDASASYRHGNEAGYMLHGHDDAAPYMSHGHAHAASHQEEDKLDKEKFDITLEDVELDELVKLQCPDFDFDEV
ncbi:hypothetical protein BG005_003768, partial [Podila minutissima]